MNARVLAEVLPGVREHFLTSRGFDGVANNDESTPEEGSLCLPGFGWEKRGARAEVV